MASPRPPRFFASASRFPELFFSALALLLAAVWIFQDYAQFSHHPGSDWNSSEWMIDYAAGFLRRGLGGAAFAAVIHLTGFGFFPLWITLTTTACLGLCANLVVSSVRLGGPPLWRLALLLNPLLLLASLEYGSFARKDMLFLWGTLLNVACASHALRPSVRLDAPRSRLPVLLLASILLSSLVLVLLHEGIFLFAWLPLNFTVLAYTLSRLRLSPSAIAWLLALTFLPVLAALAAAIHFHGDARSAATVCRSWQFADCTPGPGFPPSISALGWTLREDVIGSLGYIAGFPAYLLVFFLTASIQLVTILALDPLAKLEHLLALSVIPFIASLPLFILGADWGRWLSLVATSSLFVMLSDSLRPSLFTCLPAAAQAALHSLSTPAAVWLAWVRQLIERFRVIFFFALILLPVPPFPIRGSMLIASPVAILINFIRHFPLR